MTDDRLTRDQFIETIDLREVSADHAHDQTIRPTLTDAPGGALEPYRPPLSTVPEVFSGSGTTLRLGEKLAEGGMGVVTLAEQGALRRTVAVKVLRPEFTERVFIDRLLREAWVTGAVEHPNVVPIYSLQADAQGLPMMVMKRIQGVSWRALIRNPDHPEFPADAQDKLAWHLRVLMQVCDAAHYAHSRGVLHLDIKPDNVMVGAFRDVYLVDWGVAVSTNESHRGWLPMADSISEVLGTPAYMAPEMVDRSHCPLGVYTDVYLLGATLHEILTGEPPHRGETLHETLYAAYEGEPHRYDADVPPELADIAQRAMSPSVNRRFSSAETFRSAISDFLEHRSSANLAREANRRLDALRVSLRGQKAALSASGARLFPVEADEEVEESLRTLHRDFGETRFAFAQALREWPGNVEAQRGLSATSLLMADYHLRRGEEASAARLLDEIDDPFGDFAGQVADLRARVERVRQARAELEQLSRDMDPTVGRLKLALFIIAAAVVLSVPWIVSWVLQASAGELRYDWAHSLAFTGAIVAVFGFASTALRRTLMPNRAARQILVGFTFVALAVFGEQLIAWHAGYDALTHVPMGLLLIAGGTAVMAESIDRRLYVLAATFFVTAVLGVFVPSFMMLWAGLAATVGPITLGILWLRSQSADGDAHGDTAAGAGG